MFGSPKSWRRVCLVSVTVFLLFSLGIVFYFLRLPGKSFEGMLPALTEAEKEAIPELKETVETLAVSIGPRNMEHFRSLDLAARYIENKLKINGYSPKTHEYKIQGKIVQNIDSELVGSAPQEGSILVGAHYDSFGMSPGANDNATGVAAVLEIARRLRSSQFKRTVRFVLFTNEEPPFYHTELMGSRVYARESRLKGENIRVAVVIDMIGCYSETQEYSFPMSIALGKKADSVVFLGNLQSRDWLHRAAASFRESTRFPSRGFTVFDWFPYVDDSDHGSFWREDYSSLFVSDTGPLRNCFVHVPQDDIHQVDFGRISRVVGGLVNVIQDFAK